MTAPPRTPVLLLAAALIVAGCAAGASGGAGAGSTTVTGPTGQATPSGPAREIAVSRINDKIQPRPGRIEVAQGTRVRIEITSDIPDEAHVHGYDLHANLDPWKTATIEFVADRTGLFEVETHQGGHNQLLQLLVR
jgi:hypothetical protein